MPGILFDLDGVFYVGGSPIPGAAEALAWVRERGIPHCFLTNTTSRPRSALTEKLAGIGLDVDADDILTPPVAAARWIADNVKGGVALFVPDATRAEFAELPVSDDPDAAVGAVIVGDLGEKWDFFVLNRAFRLLMHEPRPALIALGMTRYWKAPDGLRLDTAPFVMALAHATGVEPTVLGKPARTFFEIALAMIECDAANAVMVGDDIKGDIGGAQDAGIRGILVKTGKFQPADLDGRIQPAAVLDSVAGLPDWWKQEYEGH
ncbi:MAG TPA: TIGR01458 family HAD-type hydrolase [Pelomicrobium sp.]|nr:TIGR01458 family HAD-type hydrolase [Pelomicrobium sp.]